jgi:hypothetical protein
MKWSLSKASVEFGVTRETIRRGLRNADIAAKPHQTYTTKQIFAAVAGDLKFERTRRERAEADKAEVEAARLKEEVIHRDDVTTFIRNTFAPVREDVMAMPAILATKANPENPAIARSILTEWVDAFIARRREQLPAFKAPKHAQD